MQSSSAQMGTILGEKVDRNMKSCIFFHQPNVILVILSEPSNSTPFHITVYVAAKCAVSTALRARLA